MGSNTDGRAHLADKDLVMLDCYVYRTPPPFFRQGCSVCSLGCPKTHSVDQTGLKLKDLSASASDVGIKNRDHHAQLYRTVLRTTPCRGIRSSSVSSATRWVWSQPGLGEILSQKQKEYKGKKRRHHNYLVSTVGRTLLIHIKSCSSSCKTRTATWSWWWPLFKKLSMAGCGAACS